MSGNVGENMELGAGEAAVRMKLPKKVLHFSDGIMEEFTDSETDEVPTEVDSNLVRTPEGWGPWLLLKLKETGGTTLAACDYVGEALASFLGITTPKYQYELEEYERLEAEKKEQEAKAKGWVENDETNAIQIQQPQNNNSPTPV